MKKAYSIKKVLYFEVIRLYTNKEQVKYEHIAENKDQSIEGINNCANIFYCRSL